MLLDKLQYHGSRQPDATACFFVDNQGEMRSRLSWKDLSDRTALLAGLLHKRNVALALISAEPGVGLLVSLLACLRSGVIAVPLPPPNPNSLDHSLSFWKAVQRDTQARFLLTGNRQIFADLGATLELIDPLEDLENQVVPTVKANPTAMLLYTSGSMMAPKGVKLTIEGLDYLARSCCRVWDINSQSVLASWMPYHHSFGLIFNLVLPLWSGASLVLASPKDFSTNPELWFQMIHRFRATHTAAATFGYRTMVDCVHPGHLPDLDLSSWQVGLISAEPIQRGLCETFVSRFSGLGLKKDVLCALYGLSETGPVASMPVRMACCFSTTEEKPEPLQPVSVGFQLKGTRIRIFDPDANQWSPDGKTGEIVIAGPSVFPGYLNRPHENSQAFVCIEEQTYFRTGDLGYFHEGRLFIAGRLKEVFIVNGRNFAPQDLEWLALEVDSRFLAAAAFPLPGKREKEGIALLVEVELDHEPDQRLWANLVNAVKGRVRNALGLSIGFLGLVPPETIPRTASGKLRRGACLPLLQVGPGDPEGAFFYCEKNDGGPAEQEMEPTGSLDWLRSLFAHGCSLPMDAIDPQAPLAGLSLDSMALVEMTPKIEARIGKPFHPTSFFRFATLEDLAAFLDGEE